MYLSARLDAQVPLRLIRDHGDHIQADCERAAAAMIAEAERMGRIDLLRCPCVREPEDMLAIIERVYGA